MSVGQRAAMRWFPTSILSLLFAASTFAAGTEFVRVWPQWRAADSFDRIREYFGHGENDGREIVVRTHAEQRAGMYFLVRVKADREIAGGKFVLDVIRPDSPDVKSFTFPITLPTKGGVAELGLTDGDWPGGRDMHPVAWKLTLLDKEGTVVASQHSFLWEKPSQ